MRDFTDGMAKALALSGSEYTVVDVCMEVRNGQAFSFHNDKAWIVCRINDTPQVRSVHFWLATGEKAACVELIRTILEWAKGIGCTRATTHARKGWRRVLQPEGWKQPDKLVVLEKEL